MEDPKKKTGAATSEFWLSGGCAAGIMAAQNWWVAMGLALVAAAYAVSRSKAKV